MFNHSVERFLAISKPGFAREFQPEVGRLHTFFTSPTYHGSKRVARLIRRTKPSLQPNHLKSQIYLHRSFSFPQKAGNILNFCEETVKLNGSIPLHGVPLFRIDSTELTAIAVSTAQNLLHTVAFLGTGNGKLLKVLLKPELTESRIFETVNVDANGEPILGDVLFDSKQKHIYAATSKKVSVRFCLIKFWFSLFFLVVIASEGCL